jgi:hypothetical protein
MFKNLGLGMQIALGCFIFFLLTSGIAAGMLVYIRKAEFPYLWEVDKSKSKFLLKPEQFALTEAFWGRGEWLKESKKARFWARIYRVSSILAFVS